LPGAAFCVLYLFVYIQVRTPVSPGSPVERLVLILDMLCAAIAARGAGGLLTKPLFFLLWGRLRRKAVRAIKVAAQITAGTPPPAPRPRPAAPRPSRPPPLRLPGGYAWVVPLVPGVAALASQLQYHLAEPEMARLAEAPAMRRLLNPLRHMLGIPRPPRPAAAAPKPPGDPDSDRRADNLPGGGQAGQHPTQCATLQQGKVGNATPPPVTLSPKRRWRSAAYRSDR
jgi:hypothetical protein